MATVGTEHLEMAATVVTEVLQTVSQRDWSVPARGLEWSCAHTAAHIAHDLTKYAAQLAGRVDEAYLRFKLVVAPDETTTEILRTVSSTAQLLIATVATAPDDARAWSWGPADRSGFAAMGIGEMLVHTFDITAGLDLDWRPPAVLAEAVLARLMPDVPRNDAPAALLWATGRIDVAGLAHVRDWVWRPAAS